VLALFRYQRFQSEPAGAGFTLLEVLVALVILGLALAFLTGTISDSLGRAERTEREDRAAILADGILARLGRDLPLQTGIRLGRDGELFWRLVITPVTPVDAEFPLDRIDLTIFTPTARLIGHWESLRVAPSPS
jgi:prepilin-type N-terminal cleavage/methylation domain-containing protein